MSDPFIALWMWVITRSLAAGQSSRRLVKFCDDQTDIVRILGLSGERGEFPQDSIHQWFGSQRGMLGDQFFKCGVAEYIPLRILRFDDSVGIEHQCVAGIPGESGFLHLQFLQYSQRAGLRLQLRQFG